MWLEPKCLNSCLANALVCPTTSEMSLEYIPYPNLGSQRRHRQDLGKPHKLLPLATARTGWDCGGSSSIQTVGWCPAFKQLFSVSFTGKGRRSNKWGILQAKSELWATNWTILLYLTKSGFLLSVQEIPDAKTCAHSGIAVIWCVWDVLNLLCTVSTDDIHSLPDGFQTCWNHNHWDICDPYTACTSESTCFGGNIWDSLLSREVSRMFSYLQDKISRWKRRDLFQEEHSNPPQVNMLLSPFHLWKRFFENSSAIQSFNLFAVNNLYTVEHCGEQLWWKKYHWQSPLT